jgi:hypothetical protein
MFQSVFAQAHKKVFDLFIISLESLQAVYAIEAFSEMLYGWCILLHMDGVMSRLHLTILAEHSAYLLMILSIMDTN